MASYVLIEQVVKPGRTAEVQQIMRRVWSELLEFPGCQGVRIFADPDLADRLVLLMRWARAEDFDRYQQWRAETGVAEQILSRLDGVTMRRLDHLDAIFPDGTLRPGEL